MNKILSTIFAILLCIFPIVSFAITDDTSVSVANNTNNRIQIYGKFLDQSGNVICSGYECNNGEFTPGYVWNFRVPPHQYPSATIRGYGIAQMWIIKSNGQKIPLNVPQDCSVQLPGQLVLSYSSIGPSVVCASKKQNQTNQ